MAFFPPRVAGRRKLDWAKLNFTGMFISAAGSLADSADVVRGNDGLEGSLDGRAGKLSAVYKTRTTKHTEALEEIVCLVFGSLSNVITKDQTFSAAGCQAHCLLVCECKMENTTNLHSHRC